VIGGLVVVGVVAAALGLGLRHQTQRDRYEQPHVRDSAHFHFALILIQAPN
jgi:hypothetical protein